MSNTRPPAAGVSGTVVAVCITVLVCFTLAVCCAIFIAVPDGARSGSMVVIILASLGPAVATLAALVGVRQIASHVTQLTNGLMDSKIRAGVADVLPDDVIDPAAHEQLQLDRQRRDASHGTAPR